MFAPSAPRYADVGVSVRRVVTGHDEAGRAVVSIDEITSAISSLRQGADAALVWTTQGFPVSNEGDADGAQRTIGTALENGTVFRVIDYAPGVTPRRHRTQSVDYAVVISGEIWMELDAGEEVRLQAGDVLVQRGTIHNWINRSNSICRIAFVLIAATPISRGEGYLPAEG
jgi:quercetin dioxygenase-like cupin family protein